MRLLLITCWTKTQDGRWYCFSEWEYYLTKPRIERSIMLHRNPQMLEQLERDEVKLADNHEIELQLEYGW